MRFRILGPLEVRTGQGWSGIGAAKWRALLATLLLNPGRVVPTERLIAELWDDDPPEKAANLCSVYVLRVRRLLGDQHGQIVTTRAPGYQLQLGSGDLDARLFEDLARQGRQLLAADDPQQAADVLADALGLWRGGALADVPSSALVDAEASRLEEARLAALELRIEADLGCGRHAVVIPELGKLCADYPLRERLWVLRLQALDGAGRRAEAVAAYGQAREAIADELGLDPGPRLQGIYQELLTARQRPPRPRAQPPAASPGRGPDAATASPGQAGPGHPAPDEPSAEPAAGGAAAESAPRPPEVAVAAGILAGAPARGSPAPAAGSPDTEAPDLVPPAGGPPSGDAPGAQPAVRRPAAPGAPAPTVPAPRVPVASPPAGPGGAGSATVPAQLPADVPDFTGRADQLARLCRLLEPQPANGVTAALPVAVVAGAPGLGKTALAVRAAHLLRAAYPDGQLFVSLRGAGAQPLPPDEVLARFLRDLGVPVARIPEDAQERAAMYRTELAGRRLLVVLDDAADAAQVRPLLPGSAACAVLVTSRHRLADLAGSRLLDLDVLDPDESASLLTRIIGEERAAAEPGPVHDVLAACAGLPLAIRIAGARLAARPRWNVRTLAVRLADTRRRMDELATGDLAVRACFEVSFSDLRGRSRGGGVGPDRAFRLLGLWHGPSISLPAATVLIGGASADDVADALEELVDAHLLESPLPDRYAFHDLLRFYAAEQAATSEPAQDMQHAASRVLSWYLRTADAAAAVVSPHRDRVPLGPPDPACEPLSFETADEALAWCAAERANLVAATRQAAALGLHDIAWKLPVAIMVCFDLNGYRAEWITTHRIALVSAREAADRRGEAWVLNNLGMVLSQQRAAEALSMFEQALVICREIDDRKGQARAANNLAFNYRFLGRHREAAAALRDALAVQRDAGDRYGEAVALCNLGEAHIELGHIREAVAQSQEALAIARELGVIRLEGYALYNLGRAGLSSADPAGAADLLEQALDRHHAAGDKYGEAQDLQRLGAAYARTGRAEQATASWERACGIFSGLGEDAQAAEVQSELRRLSANPGRFQARA
ncbi:MAG: AfsR/SARP family transcriptional regulator [Streptosporangiaceae bacterium]